MAGRGRGRGWGGRGGWSSIYVPPKPFVLYPEEVNCPGKIDINDDYMKNLLSWSSKFQRYWKASPYLLEERTLKGDNRKMHIERYSDRKRPMFTRDSLSQVLVFDNFPKELTEGTSKRSRKKFRWNPEANLEKRLDFFEQLEKKNEGREYEDKGEKEKEDDEDDDENAESDGDYSDDDYAQGEAVDDDEDDYNDVDEGEDIF